MDLISGIINQISPSLDNFSNGQKGGENSAELLKSTVTQFLKTQNLSSGSLTELSSNKYLLQLSNNNNVLKGVDSLVLNTDSKIPTDASTLRINPTSINFTDLAKNPLLQIQGTIKTIPTDPALAAQGKTINFTSEVDISKLSLNQQNNAASKNTGSLVSSQTKVGDQVVTNQILGANLKATISTSDIQPKLSSLVQNIASQNPALANANINNLSLNLKIESLILPATSTNPNPQAINGSAPNSILQQQNVLQAEYIVKGNQPILRTDSGSLKLDNFLNIPEGSKLSISLQNIDSLKVNTATTIGNQVLSLKAVKELLTSDNSPLQAAIKSLFAIPQGVNYVNRVLPEGSSKQAYAKALWFLSSVKSNDFESWIGKETVSRIQVNPNGEKILDTFKDLFGLMRGVTGRVEIAANGDQWQSYILPFSFEGKGEFASLYINKDPESSKNDKQKNKDKKFIVELDQDKYGKVLIEGLYNNSNEGKLNNLNLIISATYGFGESDRAELIELFSEISDSYDFSGSLEFRDKIPDIDFIIDGNFDTQEIIA